MNVIWRFLWVLIFSRFAPPVDLLAQSISTYHVLPTDVDVLLHMNNGRYFSILDLARVDFMIRNKSFSILYQNKIYPVVASEMIRFKKSLRIFQRFAITTQLIGWDDMFFYIVHYFKKDNEIYALSLVKIRMLRKGRIKISPNEVLQLVGQNIPSPNMPDWISDWLRADKEFYAESINLD